MTEKQIKPNSTMFQRQPRCSTELICLTYGLYVTKLLRDAPEGEAATFCNSELEKMGFNMGVRMIDEFFARSPQIKTCKDFKTTIETLAKQAFPMFLGVQAEVR